MSKNDERIDALLQKVTEKREALGDKPKARYNSNGVFEDNGFQKNLNVIDLTTSVKLYADLCVREQYVNTANKDLDVDLDIVIGSATIAEWKEDIALRVKVLKWAEEDKKIKILEKQLNDLRSEDAKTAAALSDIEGLL